MSEENKKKGNLIAILTMFALYAMVGFVTFLAAPAGDVWKYKLPGGSNVLGMLGNSMNFIAYLIMGYPAGKFLQKIGYKKTALLATGSGALGVLVQILSGKLEASMGLIGAVPAAWIIYLVGALISGFSNCLLNTVICPMLNQIVGGGNKGNQLNLGGSAFNSLCGASAPIILGSIVGQITKETQFSQITGVLMAAAIVFIVATAIIAVLPIPNPTSRPSTVVLERSALSFRHCRLGVIGIFLYMGIEIGTQNYMRLWLQPDNETTPLLAESVLSKGVANNEKLSGVDGAAARIADVIAASRLAGKAAEGSSPEEAARVKADFDKQAELEKSLVAKLTKKESEGGLGIELGEDQAKKIAVASIILPKGDNREEFVAQAARSIKQSAVIAASTAATFMVLMLFGRLLGALIGGKVSSRAMCLFCAGTGVLFCSLGALLGATMENTLISLPLFKSVTEIGMVPLPVGALFFILAGLSASVMWGVIFNLATEGLGKYTEQAAGLFMVMVVGGAILPSFQAWIADKFGFMTSYVVPIFCFAYLFIYALAFSKNVNKDIKVD